MADAQIDQIIGGLGSVPGLLGGNFTNLIAFTIGLVVYAIFVWHFHKYIGRRDIFGWDTEKFERSGGLGKFGQGLMYFAKYLVAYPVLVFVWFGVFASFMFVLSTGFDVQKILLISFALVTAVRIAAYYKEELALELARLLPLNLLVIYLIQPVMFDFAAADRVFEISTFAGDVLRFMLFSVSAEWVIRAVWSVKQRIAPRVHPEPDMVKRFGR